MSTTGILPTQRIRSMYANAFAWDMGDREERPDLQVLRNEQYAEFDAWIAQHDREVQAEAFEAAAVRVRANFAEHGERCPWVGFLDDEAARIRKGETNRADAAKRVL